MGKNHASQYANFGSLQFFILKHKKVIVHLMQVLLYQLILYVV